MAFLPGKLFRSITIPVDDIRRCTACEQQANHLDLALGGGHHQRCAFVLIGRVHGHARRNELLHGAKIAVEGKFEQHRFHGDVLLERTGAPGLHCRDGDETQRFWLPEWSRMSASEADRFTAAFNGMVQRKLAAREVAGGIP